MGRITTRWIGPGILGRKQEIIGIRVPGMAREGAIPGRSARSRYVAPKVGIRSTVQHSVDLSISIEIMDPTKTPQTVS